jgi:hypothetical protein
LPKDRFWPSSDAKEHSSFGKQDSKNLPATAIAPNSLRIRRYWETHV